MFGKSPREKVRVLYTRTIDGIEFLCWSNGEVSWREFRYDSVESNEGGNDNEDD